MLCNKFKKVDDDDDFQYDGGSGQSPWHKKRDMYQDHINKFTLKESEMVRGVVFKRPYTDVRNGVIGVSFFLIWIGLLVFAFCVGDWAALNPKAGLIKDLFIMINSKAMICAVLQAFAVCIILNIIMMVLLYKAATVVMPIIMVVVMIAIAALTILGVCYIPDPDFIIFGAWIIIFIGQQLQAHWLRLEIGASMVELVGEFFVQNMRIVVVSVFYVIIHLVAFFANIMAGVLLGHAKGYESVFIFYCITAWPIYLVFSQLIHNIVCYTTSVAGVFYYYDASNARIMEGLKWAHGRNFGSLVKEAALMNLVKPYRLVLFLFACFGVYTPDFIEMMDPAEDNCDDGTCLTDNWRTFADCLDEMFLPYMAMSGNSFIPSAKKAFLLDLKYMEDLYFIREVFWFTLFMAKLLVVIITSLIFWLIVSIDSPEFQYGLTFPMYFVTFFSMVICFSMMGLFNHVEVAILVAMCMDWDLHGKPDQDVPCENMIQQRMKYIREMTLEADIEDPLD